MNTVYSQVQTASGPKGNHPRMGWEPRYNYFLKNDARRGEIAYYGDLFAPKDFKATEFRMLAHQWKAETALKSNMAAKAIHPAYQAIIAMGETAIPYILEDMQRAPIADWFWALKFIARHLSPPNTDAIAGQVREMAKVWIKWGKERGFLNTSQAA